MNVAGDNCILQDKNQLKDMIQKEPRMQHKWSDTKWITDIVTISGQHLVAPEASPDWWLQSRVRKTPSARQQCWPETFCESGKFFRIRKVFATRWRISGHFGKCPDTIQNIQIICNASGWTGKFPDYLKSVGMNWNLSRWCSVRII